jgi:hypothetical protein
MQYRWFRKTKGLNLGNRLSAFPYLRKAHVGFRGDYTWSKKDMSWPFAELYYRVYGFKEMLSQK